MSIRLKGAQVTRIREAVHRFEYVAWQGKVAREDLVKEILEIVLPEITVFNISPMAKWFISEDPSGS